MTSTRHKLPSKKRVLQCTLSILLVAVALGVVSWSHNMWRLQNGTSQLNATLDLHTHSDQLHDLLPPSTASTVLQDTASTAAAGLAPVTADVKHIEILAEPTTCVFEEQEASPVVYLIFSFIVHKEQRKLIRESWGKIMHERHEWANRDPIANEGKIVFVCGTGVHEKDIKFREEIQKYGDILLGNFSDQYANLPEKVLFGFNWAWQNCNNTRYLVKIDDHTFLHVPNFLNKLNQVSLMEIADDCMMGHALIKKPVNIEECPSCIDNKTFTASVYPPHLDGAVYVTPITSVPRILDAAKTMTYIPKDDVFVTGIVRMRAGMGLIDISAMPSVSRTQNLRQIDTVCIFAGGYTHLSLSTAQARASRSLFPALWKAQKNMAASANCPLGPEETRNLTRIWKVIDENHRLLLKELSVP